MLSRMLMVRAAARLLPTHPVVQLFELNGLIAAILVQATALCVHWWPHYSAGIHVHLSAPPHPFESGSVLWPILGLALAAAFVFGARSWVGLGLGLAATAFWRLPAWAGIGLFLVEFMLIVGASWVFRALGCRSNLGGRHDLTLFLLLGPILTALLSAIAEYLAHSYSVGTLDSSGHLIFLWLRNAAGILVFGLPLLSMRGVEAPINAPARRWAAAAMLISAAIVCLGLGVGIRVRTQPEVGIELALLCLFLVPVFIAWLAALSNWRVASLLACLLAAASAISFSHGRGIFLEVGEAPGVILMFAYCMALTCVPLLLGAVQRSAEFDSEQWKQTLNSAAVGAAQWDDESDQILLSQGWLQFLGFKKQIFGQSRQALWGQVHPDDRPSLREGLLRLAEKNSTDSVAFRMRARDGTWRWLQGCATVLKRSRYGSPLLVRAIARDTTLDREVQERQELSTQLFQHLQEGLLVTDAAYRVLDANPMFTRITGYTREEMLGQVPALLRQAQPGNSESSPQDAIQESLHRRGSWHGELEGRHRDGTPSVLKVTISAVFNLAGETAFFVLAMTDITQSRAQTAELGDEFRADSLTQLPMRASFEVQLSKVVASAERDGLLIAVACIDLDHFRSVNERLGVAQADLVLRAAAERLTVGLDSWSHDLGIVGRLGADQFGIVLQGDTPEALRSMLGRVQRRLSQPYKISSRTPEVDLSCSVGATIFPLDVSDSETLLRHAQQAVYAAKSAGRNRIQIFDTEDRRRSEARASAEALLLQGMESHQFLLYFQPEVNLSSNRVVGVEALLRWNHPKHGVIPPSQFLPLLGDSELAARLNQWVLDTALSQSAQWFEQGLNLDVHVNVPAAQLQAPDFAQRLGHSLAAHDPGIAQKLVLEVLESSALSDVDSSHQVIQACRALGVRFALDDFGTGYSTLTYLKRLPVDFLKIDRSFVNNMLNDAQDLAIVEGVIALAKTFSCEMIAEGVRTQAQADKLLELGCVFAQGHGIGRALKAEEVPQWILAYRGIKPSLSSYDSGFANL